jgi:hypothetical protein
MVQIEVGVDEDSYSRHLTLELLLKGITKFEPYKDKLLFTLRLVDPNQKYFGGRDSS